MSENISTIKDPTVHIKSNEKLYNFLHDNFKGPSGKLPENLKLAMKKRDALLKLSDIEYLNRFLKENWNSESPELLTGIRLYEKLDKIIESNYADLDFNSFLEEINKNETYLHDLLKDSELVLPENERIPRNPVLAERIERLKKEQEEREYKEMTKNVDMSKKHVTEDSISYQLNMMNRHLIAVAQFIVSVGAGFAFGFLGIELIVGDLNFGFRLLLGIACALIIAVAEFYFLAKHLNEEESPQSKENEKPKPTSTKSKPKGKPHKD